MKKLLGKINGEYVYLEKHKWDCGWYWGFGYIRSESCNFHIDSLITRETDINKIFESTKVSQEDWWILRDLFIQAYAIKKCTEVYRHGGNQTEKAKPFRVVRDDELIKRLNSDLEILLNNIWDFIK